MVVMVTTTLESGDRENARYPFFPAAGFVVAAITTVVVIDLPDDDDDYYMRERAGGKEMDCYFHLNWSALSLLL